MTVLIVDDEPNDLSASRSTLERAGFEVIGASSYQSALQTFEEKGCGVDLALIDISLPERNGVELFQELSRRNPSLKVLFVSGNVGAELIRFYRLPATDRHFLRKPFKPEQLLARVREIIGLAEPLRLEDRSRSAAGDAGRK